MDRQTHSSERALAQSYDTIPYAGNPYYHTHPSVLAAYGALYGLSPSPPERSRVLELGCGDGGNILPMAYDFPDSEFLGVDLSPVQIGIGREGIETIGLKNIRLTTRSIMDMGAADGKFDYIIAHGVYSWVPEQVRNKILAICRENLSDQGIAHISYNVLPGCRFDRSIRDMVLYRTRHLKAPQQRVTAALDLIGTLLSGTADGSSIHDVQLRHFGKRLKSTPDLPGYLLHEYMEPENTPFYFHQFADDLKKYDLQYICDAEQEDFELDGLPPEVAGKFEEISEDGMEVEQYIDFLKNTRFRRSLLCHGEITLDSAYRPERMMNLHAATSVSPILDSPDSATGEVPAFKTSTGRQFSTRHHVAGAILHMLSEIKPCTMAVGSLIEAIAEKTAKEQAPDMQPGIDGIGQAIYSLFFNGVLELLGVGRRCVLETGEFPTVSPVSRLQAPSRRLTNLCHRTIVMDDDMAVFILAHLDGTRNRETLVELMTEAVRTGRVEIPNFNPGEKRPEEIRLSMGDQLRGILQRLPRCGVLLEN